MFYFLYGTSPYLELENEKITNKILIDFPNIQIKYFDCSQKEEEDFFISVQSNSIFSSTECLILKRCEILKSSGIQKTIKALKNFDLSKKILIILYNVPLQYNKIVPEYELTKATIKNIEELASFIDCTNKNDSILSDYIKNKLEISDKECEELIDLLGNDFYHIKNEINKISIFLNGEKYSFEKVRNIISVDIEYSLKELIENFFKTKNNMDIINFLEKNKDAYMGLIYILSEELIVFLKLASLIKEGKITKNISYNVFKELYESFSDLFLGKNNKIQHPYVIYLKLNNFDDYTFTEKFLTEKLKELLYIEYKIKSGEAEVDLELVRYLLQFYK